MRKIIRFGLIFAFALTTGYSVLHHIILHNGIVTVVKVAAILAIFEVIVKPIIKILLLPINILTLGLFRVVINTFGLYIATFLVSDFAIGSAYLPRINILGIIIPALELHGFLSYLFTSIIVGSLFNFFKLILNRQCKK